MQEAADDLVKLYKRISLDDDLDDTLRGELLSQLTAGASLTQNTLRLVTGLEPHQGEQHTMKMCVTETKASGGVSGHGDRRIDRRRDMGRRRHQGVKHVRMRRSRSTAVLRGKSAAGRQLVAPSQPCPGTFLT